MKVSFQRISFSQLLAGILFEAGKLFTALSASYTFYFNINNYLLGRNKAVYTNRLLLD